MMSKAASPMGFRVRVLDPDPACPAALVADETVVGSLSDPSAVARFAKDCDVITLDTEHVPFPAIEAAEAHCKVRPSSRVMATVQDRLLQRQFLAKHGFPAPKTAPVSTAEELAQALQAIGAPSILKTRTGGYDGKGQARIDRSADGAEAWKSLGNRPAILESFVRFEKEVSVLLARRPDGEKAFYGLAENVHRNGILHTTLAPARVSAAVAENAKKVAGGIADALGHVGVMAVELFVLPSGEVLVNEIAPRVHNSGHYTLDACATSQFEQHVRAVFGLALGDPAQFTGAVMLNLLGDLWRRGAPDWDEIVSSEAHLHLYGKRLANPGRKMGHVTFLHDDPAKALTLANETHDRLSAGAGP
jgi:5-(carboxyamino)imidazole ribonucleotide synthase